MNNALVYLVGLLDFWPGLKTKIAAGAAFVVAIIQAWDAAVPQLGLDPAVYVVNIPPAISAIIMALLGIGASNAQTRLDNQIKALRK